MFFRRSKKPKEKSEARVVVPDGLWLKCESCNEILYKKELEKNLWTCPKCNFHFRIKCRNYIELLLDEASLVEQDKDLEPTDPLKFPNYKKKLKSDQEKTKMKEAIVYGLAKVGGIPVVFAAMDFGFRGGSMGWVVGEKVARAIRTACEKEIPLIILSTSGGARMQEGIFSLMQMAKTSAELAILAEKKLPYISIITNPTTGGVTASYAALGDIIIAEPGALLGFTGPRVIEQTIGEKLPQGFQRSEFQLKHGMIDMIVHRRELRTTLIQVLQILYLYQ